MPQALREGLKGKSLYCKYYAIYRVNIQRPLYAYQLQENILILKLNCLRFNSINGTSDYSIQVAWIDHYFYGQFKPFLKTNKYSSKIYASH